MRLEITMTGASSTSEVTELEDWLQRARIKGVESVKQLEDPPKPGEQGPTLLALLTVVLGSQALVELVRTIHRYIEARTPHTVIRIREGDRTIEIDSTNPPPLAEMVEQARQLSQPE